MNNTYWNILKDYPPSYVNNSREIVKYYLEKFKKSPSMYWANKLESLGVIVDFDNNNDCFLTEEDFNKQNNG